MPLGNTPFHIPIIPHHTNTATSVSPCAYELPPRNPPSLSYLPSSHLPLLSHHFFFFNLYTYPTSSPIVMSIPCAEAIQALVREWKACIDKSKSMLQQTRTEKVTQTLSDEEKRQWWQERYATNDSIAALLMRLQDILGPAGMLLVGDDHHNNNATKPTTMTTLTQAVDAMTVTDGLAFIDGSGAGTGIGMVVGSEILTMELVDEMKVTEIRRRLKECGLSTIGRKGELSQRLLDHQQQQQQQPQHNACNHGPQSDDILTPSQRSDNPPPSDPRGDYTILILDEVLQQIPWECIPILHSRRCSRIPSMALFLHMITLPHNHHHTAASSEISTQAINHTTTTKTSTVTGTKTKKHNHNNDNHHNHNVNVINHTHDHQNTRGKDHERCWYAIDPERNLATTRSTMVAFLEPYIAKYQWPGYVAEMPPENMIKTLHAQHDLFIYCGHGAGEKMCETHKMRHWLHVPAAYLWGCSSGRLAVLGVHDPHGAALNYLLGGAPYVVGNMWDVTDKDIDKLSKECMRRCFEEQGSEKDQNSNGVKDKNQEKLSERLDSGNGTKEVIDNGGVSGAGMIVTEALVQSRGICKMKYAVGCAPVVYGLLGNHL